MNKTTYKERTEKNNIVCPNCHINIKVLTDDLFLPMGDEWHDDMYISHEEEYLERKALQHRISKAIEYMEHYIEVEDAQINERIKIEFKYVIDILRGEDEKNKEN